MKVVRGFGGLRFVSKHTQDQEEAHIVTLNLYRKKIFFLYKKILPWCKKKIFFLCWDMFFSCLF